MQPIVDLAPGAEDNALAVRFAQRLRQNLADRPKKVASFASLRAAVLVVAEDKGEAFTMRFDHGRVTIHDGQIGMPTITFCAPEERLLGLFDLRLTPLFRLPRAGSLVRPYATGELLVYGLFSHARTVVRVLRALSSDS